MVELGSAVSAADRFQKRLEDWLDHIDPSWSQGQVAVHLQPFANEDRAVRARVATAVFERWCGPLPEPEALWLGAGPWALCNRTEMLPRLCALALALRPGVLRCCVDTRVRQSLRRALGDCFDRLRENARGGRSVAADAARRDPIAWACIGYRDAVRAGLLPSHGLRRFMRLALPRAWSPDMRDPDHPVQTLNHGAAAAVSMVVSLRGGQPW